MTSARGRAPRMHIGEGGATTGGKRGTRRSIRVHGGPVPNATTGCCSACLLFAAGKAARQPTCHLPPLWQAPDWSFSNSPPPLHQPRDPEESAGHPVGTARQKEPPATPPLAPLLVLLAAQHSLLLLGSGAGASTICTLLRLLCLM